MRLKVAIVSPSKDSYSETFIQAHRNIDADVCYYYGNYVPIYLDDTGYIGPKFNFITRVVRFIKSKVNKNLLNPSEEAFIISLKKNSIDIILAEYGTTAVHILKSCKKANIPLVPIFHGFDASVKSIIDGYKIGYIELFDYAKNVIVVSNSMKKQLINLGCDSKKIVYTPCAPNDQFIKITPSYSEQQSFAAIGRFVNKKAPYYLILAMQKVVQKYPKAKLYFGGDGELFETCKNLIKYFKLENNVILLGKIKPEEYARILSKVIGFIQHSVTALNGDMEGTPVAVLEASAAGIPVIATKHAGIQDVIIEEKSGFLVDEHDVDGMASNIIRIIEDKELAIQMGHFGKQYVKENFSMQKHLNLILSALKN